MMDELETEIVQRSGDTIKVSADGRTLSKLALGVLVVVAVAVLYRNSRR